MQYNSEWVPTFLVLTTKPVIPVIVFYEGEDMFLLGITLACTTYKPNTFEDTATTSTNDSETSEDLDTSTPSDTEDTQPDSGDVDTETELDTGEPEEARISCSVSTTFLLPQDYEHFMLGTEVTSTVQLGNLSSYTGYSIRWEDDAEQEVASTSVETDGQTDLIGSHFTQQKGFVDVHARLITPDGICEDTIIKPITVCTDQLVEDFTIQPTNWVLHGDAYWDTNGWVEMTGIAKSKKGAVYNTIDSISQGAASIRFTLRTGNGLNGGADGFAFTIINTNSTALEGLLDLAWSGGGMAYGIGGPYGSWTGNAITVEIDTWHNVYNGTNEVHTDPTNVSHIALTKNADPSNHIVWFEVPSVEDYQDHSIRVDIYAGNVRVFYDDAEVINQPVNINFKGGEMFFSGSTGWATNYHIFDDLEIYHDCQ